MIPYAEVLAALDAYPAVQREVLRRFRATRASSERWALADVWSLATALARAEGMLDFIAPDDHGARAALTAIRHRLESELVAEAERRARRCA